MEDSTQDIIKAVSVGVGVSTAIFAVMFALEDRSSKLGVLTGALATDALLSDWMPGSERFQVVRTWTWVEATKDAHGRTKSSQKTGHAASVRLITEKNAPHRKHPDIGKWWWSVSAPGAPFTKSTFGTKDTMAAAQQAADEWLEANVS